MQLIVTAFDHGAVRVVLAGSLDISGAETLDLPLATIAGGGGGVVVDMTMLECIASIGIRHLVLAARALRRGRGRLVLLDPNPHVTDTLLRARVDDLLPIVRSEEDARAALGCVAAAR
jgi:anti-anti-sigma factor